MNNGPMNHRVGYICAKWLAMHIQGSDKQKVKAVCESGEKRNNIFAHVCRPPPHFRQLDNSTTRSTSTSLPVFSPAKCPLPSLSKLSSAMKVQPSCPTHTTHADPLHSLERPSNLSKSQDGENIISTTKSVFRCRSISSISTNHKANRPLRHSKR